MSNALVLKVVFAAVDKFRLPVKAISEGASALSKELKQSRDQLKSLNDQQSKISGFEKTVASARAASESFGKAKAAVAEYQKKLDDQRASQAKVAGEARTLRKSYQSLFAAIQKTPNPAPYLLKNLAMQKDALDAVETRYNKAQNTSRRMKEELQDLTKQVKTAKDYKDKLSLSLREATVKLKDAGLSTKDLAAAQADLKTKIDATSAAADIQSKKMERRHAADAYLAKSREKADKVAGFGAKAIAGGAAINAAAAIPVVAYANAEDAQTQLRIAMMQKGGQISDQFKEIDALAAQLGNKLPGTTADFQNMMTMLIRQGMPAESLLGGLGKATAYLAVQLKMAPEAAAEFSSKLQDATRTTSQDMMGLMDTIQRMFYLGVDQNNMLEAFKGLGPAMDLIKRQGLEGTKALAPFVVMMDQAGMRGESAGNAIRKVIASGLNVDKIKKIQADLKKEKGISLNLDFTDGKGEFGGIDKLMAELSKLKKFDTVTRLAILKDIYGDDKENNEVLSKIIEKGAAGYADVQAKMANQANIQERVNAQLGTLKSLWDAATGTFTNALVAFGESISPELHATAEWLGKVAERTQAWAKENPELSNTIMSIVKWAGLAALAIGGIALAAGSIIVPLAVMKVFLASLGISGAGAFGMIGKAIAIVGRALLLNPIGLTLTGIATAAYLIYENWDWLKEKFTAIIDFILGKIDRFKELMRTLSGGTLFGDARPGAWPVVAPSGTAAATPATLTPVVAPAAKQRVAAPSIFNINVTGNHGASPAELAAQIRREMESAERDKAARQRSRLRDTE